MSGTTYQVQYRLSSQTEAQIWNPTRTDVQITLSNGDLTVAMSGTTKYSIAYGLNSFSSGSLYFESVVNYTSQCRIGVGNTNSAVNSTAALGSSIDTIGWQFDGSVFNNGAIIGTWATYSTGVTLCVAVDVINRLIWGRVGSGFWNNNASANPSTGVGGLALPAGVVAFPVVPAIEVFQSSLPDHHVAHFSASSFQNAPPTGFTSMDVVNADTWHNSGSPVTGPPVTVTGLTNLDTYDFQVVAISAGGQAASPPLTIIVGESADATYYNTFPSSVLYASQSPGSFATTTLDQWQINSVSIILHNGTTITSNGKALYYKNHTVYVQNATGWFDWTGSALSAQLPAVNGILLSTLNYTSGATAGTVVAQITATCDTGAAFSGTITIGGTNASSFAIDSSYRLLVASGQTLSASSYQITLTGVSQAGLPFPAFTSAVQKLSASTGLTAPSQAATAGFTNLVFNDDFTSNTVFGNVTSTVQPGINWYGAIANQASPTNYQVLTTSTAASIAATLSGNTTGAGSNASSSGGIFRINGISSIGDNGNFQSVTGSGNNGPNSWKHGYFEVYFAFDKTLVTSQAAPAGPAVWSWSQTTGTPVEVDFMECYATGTGPQGNFPAMTIHDPGAGTVRGNIREATAGDSNWHTVGMLWRSTGSGIGTLDFYWDNTHIGNQYTTGTGNTVPDMESIIGQFFALGTGVGCPMYVDWVRVWQAAANQTSRPFLIGLKNGTSPAFHTISNGTNGGSGTGYPADFKVIYASPDLNVSGGGGELPSQYNYPVVIAQAPFEFGSSTTPLTDCNAAANHSYDATWTTGITNNIAPFQSRVYAVRIGLEWATFGGSIQNSGPYAGGATYTAPRYSASVWLQAWRNLAHLYRLHAPNVKIAWDYPCCAQGGHTSPPDWETNWYPSDVNGDGFGDLVDIISTDLYIGGSTGDLGGYTIATTATGAYNVGGYGRNQMVAFANAKGKPMALWETGIATGSSTEATDMNGLCSWIKSNNFCAAEFWDQDVWTITGDAAKLGAWQANMGQAVTNAQYTGTFFNWQNPANFTILSGF